MLYTLDQVEFLRREYPNMLIPKLTVEFNKRFDTHRTEASIRCAIKNRKILSGRKKGIPIGQSLLFTEEQVLYIRKNYPGRSRREVTRLFNEQFGLEMQVSQITSFVKNHKIKSGRTGCFEKGCKPWNTGSVGVCKPNDGSFQKGGIPHNIKPVGFERVCKKNGWILIKVEELNPYTGAKTRFKAKHVVLWEAENGPVPKDKVLRFIDANPLHSDISNLDLIDKRVHLRLNQLGHKELPIEARPTMLTLAKLDVKRFEREKSV